jgi:hypothetical protein
MYGFSDKKETSAQEASPLLEFNFILKCDSEALLLWLDQWFANNAI